MNKTAIKKFAIEARNKLRTSVIVKAGMLGITEEECSSPITKGTDFEIYETAAGTEVTLNRSQCEQRRKLVDQINARGFDTIIEEVAYTWFNRICAIRFMEVNDYLPSRVRVLSSEKAGKTEPDIVTQAPDVDLDFTDKEREFILDAKMNNKSDELFRMLFIKQCNKLSEILPELFEATEDYTEMLLNISYTNEDDIVRMLVDEDGIPEEDFNVSARDDEGNVTGQVEIIGWLYQYYNTELKDDTFAKLKKNIKISKERIPAATQLFTPDWIVRYMVENSVGRLWIEHLRANDSNVDEKQVAESLGWKYYLPEAEQEDDVNIKLAEIRTTYKDLRPEDITCIDPCMGSGHILIAMFDVLMDIYKSAGYSERDAAFLIVENNIHGLDIDKRAYQLAYFAVMMKGRGYNRRFFVGKQNEEGERVAVQPQVYVIEESNGINRAQLKYFGADLNEVEKNDALNQIIGLLDELKDAREYGSLLNISKFNWDLLDRYIVKESSEGQMNFDTLGIDETKCKLERLVKIGQVVEKKYDAVATNPPYMSLSNGSSKLNDYVQEKYPCSKTDMFAVFIERCRYMLKRNAFQAMITQQAWMFTAIYSDFRLKLREVNICSLVQLGARAFDEINGEVVQTATFVIRNSNITNYQSDYVDLTEGNDETSKKRDYLLGKNHFTAVYSDFDNVPNCAMSYWLSRDAMRAFGNKKFLSSFTTREGMTTANNDLFLRNWYEVEIGKIGFGIKNEIESEESGYKWFPYNKGGPNRKWYGNNDLVVNWYQSGREIRNIKDEKTGRIRSHNYNLEYSFCESGTWTAICSGAIMVRYSPKGALFDSKGASFFADSQQELFYGLGLLNSKVSGVFLKVLSPAYEFKVGHVANVPLVVSEKDRVVALVKLCIELAKKDWDAFETSWGFLRHPLVPSFEQRNREKRDCVAWHYEKWVLECLERFDELKVYEKELNGIFINAYGLQKELIADVEDKDVTVHRAELQRDIKSLISYAVGCIFGRYSFDTDGVVFAGGELDDRKYNSFILDRDNCIPITDEEYFQDDIVGRFVEFIKVVYGADTLEENLDFIANALGNKGDTSRAVIRNYFLNDFMADHLKVYQKRPIYWMFDSGKANGFKALIYLHRYNTDTVGTVRTEYLHKTQQSIENAMKSAEYIADNAAGSEKSKATKLITKYTKQLAEIKQYDEAMAHIANQRIKLDLDDGVKVNYEKFQGVEVAQEGKKAQKIDLLAKIK